ncbi:MAG: helix-turn-helix domain-containing protein [Proteobacteria bacterium]|nr:helix-turn-helix domain-containing protein [Pseudomonadota bacterium]
MPEQIAANLASNIRKLREARGLTQQQMARASGVPRPTWANLESGAANPTLSVLVKVANALQVRLEELIGPPKASAKFYPADSLPVRRRGKVVVRKLLPEAIPGLEIERMEFPPTSQMTGVPHTPGTREYLTCETGEVELSAAGTSWRLKPGELVVFRGDQKHGYRNVSRGRTIAYSVVAFAPVAD